MISVPSLRLNQFGVRFYEALLSGEDLQSLVGFEVLSFGPGSETTRGKSKIAKGKVNWEFLERRISASEQAFQRPIIKKKIDELVAYYLQCADSGTLPAIPGSVLLVSEKRLEFAPSSGRSDAGSLKLPEESGILRALDGQHRLLALHQLAENHSLKDFQVPAVVFDNLTADQVVELFVTINSKHTKLNPSHLISLAGRRLYRDDNLAAAHDVIRTLNEDEGSPLKGSIKVLGIGKGTVTQASLADELRDVFAAIDTAGGRDRARVPRERAALLPQLLQGGGPGIPDGLRRTQVLDQELHLAARLHPHRALRHRHGPQARRRRVVGRGARCRAAPVGRVDRRPPLRDGHRLEGKADGRHPLGRGDPGARAAAGAKRLSRRTKTLALRLRKYT